MLRRRTFLQSLFALSAVLLPVQAERPAPRQPPSEIDYTDSQNTDPATLAALYDGDRQSGGVEYQP